MTNIHLAIHGIKMEKRQNLENSVMIALELFVYKVMIFLVSPIIFRHLYDDSKHYHDCENSNSLIS